MNSPVYRTPARLLWSSLATAALLAGCGGDPSPPAASLSGVAAVGVPIVNGTVAVSCAGGSALSTTTSSAGAWQVTFAGQTLPCAVQVSGGTVSGSANATPYHSIAITLGTVNITPLTDLLVAQLTGSSPQSWFTAPIFTNVNASTVNTALSNLTTGLGIASTLGTTNPITTAFAAQAGNPIDNLLEAFKTALANLSQTYAALLSAAQSGSYAGFNGFGAAFSTAYQALPVTPPVGAAGSLSIQISLAGSVVNTVNLPGIPRPANQTEFCSGLTSDPTFSNGGFTVVNCAFSGNVGTVNATLATPGLPALPYGLTYTYN